MSNLRIGAISDIHVDINQETYPEFYEQLIGFLSSTKLDVLVIAGDIAGKNSVIKEFLFKTSDLDIENKLYVPGNHCLWSATELNSWDLYLGVLPELCKKLGWHFLPHNPIIIDSTAFLGTPGWYDYSTRNKIHDDRVKLKDYSTKKWGRSVWNDVNFIKFGKSDREVSEMFNEQINEDYFNLFGDDLDKKFDNLVMVSHVVPYADMVLHTGDLGWDFFSAFIGNESLGLWFDEVSADYHRKIAIFGHTHHPKVKTRSNGVEAYCVPLGYPHEMNNGDLNSSIENAFELIIID